jgi:hypothetical protein
MTTILSTIFDAIVALIVVAAAICLAIALNP